MVAILDFDHILYCSGDKQKTSQIADHKILDIFNYDDVTGQYIKSAMKNTKFTNLAVGEPTHHQIIKAILDFLAVPTTEKSVKPSRSHKMRQIHWRKDR